MSRALDCLYPSSLLQQNGRTMASRVAFLTIGQSPRPDLVPEMLAETRAEIAPFERGALDGLAPDEIAALAPRPGEPCLVSRLADGREVLLAAPALEQRLRRVLADLDRSGFDLIVLLCSGHFGAFRLATPFIEPQHTVDHFVQGLAYGRERIGVLLPHPQQIADFPGIPGLTTRFAAVSPYAPGCDAALATAAASLAETGLIVMHCMGYSERMRRQVREIARCPVLLAHGLIAGAIDMVLA
jgi:protein AroM